MRIFTRMYGREHTAYICVLCKKSERKNKKREPISARITLSESALSFAFLRVDQTKTPITALSPTKTPIPITIKMNACIIRTSSYNIKLFNLFP